MKKRIFSFIPVGDKGETGLDFSPRGWSYLTGRLDLIDRAGGLYGAEFTVLFNLFSAS
jgi:hypothetical protein